jgi:hypothetical protein
MTVPDEQESGAPKDQQELIDRVERSWRSWVDAVEGVPSERLTEPMVGHWSTKDQLGHVAFWEDWVIGHCQRILADEPEPDDNPEAMNEGQVESTKASSVAEQLRYRDDAHARLAAFLATIAEHEPKLPRLVKALEWETYLHYDEHAEQVRAWRRAEGI